MLALRLLKPRHFQLNSALLTKSKSITTQAHPKATPTILKSQRPMSPHLTIYQPQLTWLMSIGHRVTGASLATAVYAFGLVSSTNIFPGDLTMKMCELVASMPIGLVLAGKFVLAAPFTFHLFNGVRHLVWDWGRALTLRGVYVSGWLVNVATLISSAAITFL